LRHELAVGGDEALVTFGEFAPQIEDLLFQFGDLVVEGGIVRGDPALKFGRLRSSRRSGSVDRGSQDLDQRCCPVLGEVLDGA
jgi:hypothetical protein